VAHVAAVVFALHGVIVPVHDVVFHEQSTTHVDGDVLLAHARGVPEHVPVAVS